MRDTPRDYASALLSLFSSARDTTVAFVLASVGTLIGTAVAWMALSQRLGAGGWQVNCVCQSLMASHHAFSMFTDCMAASACKADSMHCSWPQHSQPPT